MYEGLLQGKTRSNGDPLAMHGLREVESIQKHDQADRYSKQGMIPECPTT
jgi:hypothetical protein